MTGYANRAGSQVRDGVQIEWDWDLRSVNGRGLDVRLRLPEHVVFMEKKLRDLLGSSLARGQINLGLRMRIASDTLAPAVDTDALLATLRALQQITVQAEAVGFLLQPPNALELLSWRGVQPHGPDSATIAPESLEAVLLEDFRLLLAEFQQSRATEGAALRGVLDGQIDELARLTDQARALTQTRGAELRAHFRKLLAQILEAGQADPGRAEQELALLAVKTDLAEELDRLSAHCAAARALLETPGPVGRKLDFLTQEFNREANTLCSKAQHLEMTRIGLDLKVVIDQMREQVQNVE
ncbi:MAG: YicC family protein [Rhodobacteraceae bacterium]|nr:MAG: YicC family protein [Paracoccaceae bacterium]